MENSNRNIPLQLFSRLLILFGFYLIGAFLGQFLGLLAVINLLKVNSDLFQNPTEAAKFLMDFIGHPENYLNGHKAMLSLQWFNALGSFMFSAWAFNRWVEKDIINPAPEIKPSWQVYVWCFVLVIISNPAMEALSYLNFNMHLPAGMSQMENSIRQTEAALNKLTLFLLDMKNYTDFLMVSVVVALAAAVGEELMFRGIIQNLFMKYLGKPHLAIWLTAFIFSYIHFQFLGFFPRLFLGALLGYLYYWYRTLYVPIVFHFFNNFLIIAAAYLYKTNGLSLDELMKNQLPEWWTIQLSLALIFFYVQRFYKNKLN